jgi:hypothetical protein
VSVETEEFAGLSEFVLFELLLFDELELFELLFELLQAATTRTTSPKASNELRFFKWRLLVAGRPTVVQYEGHGDQVWVRRHRCLPEAAQTSFRKSAHSIAKLARALQ